MKFLVMSLGLLLAASCTGPAGIEQPASTNGSSTSSPDEDRKGDSVHDIAIGDSPDTDLDSSCDDLMNCIERGRWIRGSCVTKLPSYANFGEAIGDLDGMPPGVGFWSRAADLGLLIPARMAPLMVGSDGELRWLSSTVLPVSTGTVSLLREGPTGVEQSALAPVFQPAAGWSTEEGAVVYGAHNLKPPWTIAMGLTRDGLVRWNAVISRELLEAQLPAETTGTLHPLASPLNVALIVGGGGFGWYAWAATVNDGIDSECVMALYSIDLSSGQTTLSRVVSMDDGNCGPYHPPRLAVSATGTVAILDPSPPKVYPSVHSYVNGTVRIRCFDPKTGGLPAAVVRKPLDMKIPLAMVPNKVGFQVLSAVLDEQPLPPMEEKLKGIYPGARSFEVATFDLGCKPLGTRKFTLWTQREFQVSSLRPSRLPSGGVFLSGLTRKAKGNKHVHHAAGYVVFDRNLRVLKSVQVSDEADALPPQPLHDGRIVRTLCKLIQAEKSGLDIDKCYYRISNDWLHDSCEQAGVCHGLSPADCKVDDPCRVPTCDPVTGCGSVPLAEGAPCGTGGVCTQGKCVQ